MICLRSSGVSASLLRWDDEKRINLRSRSPNMPQVSGQGVKQLRAFERWSGKEKKTAFTIRTAKEPPRIGSIPTSGTNVVFVTENDY